MKIKPEKLSVIEEDIFDTVYRWGQVGIIVDEKCNTFQSLMKRYRKQVLLQSKNHENKTANK